jgi:hypothetical protein
MAILVARQGDGTVAPPLGGSRSGVGGVVDARELLSAASAFQAAFRRMWRADGCQEYTTGTLICSPVPPSLAMGLLGPQLPPRSTPQARIGSPSPGIWKTQSQSFVPVMVCTG